MKWSGTRCQVWAIWRWKWCPVGRHRPSMTVKWGFGFGVVGFSAQKNLFAIVQKICKKPEPMQCPPSGLFSGFVEPSPRALQGGGWCKEHQLLQPFPYPVLLSGERVNMKKMSLELHFAAAAALCAAGAANAAVVYSGVLNMTIPANIDGVYMNVMTGASGSAGSAVAGWDVNPYGATYLSFYAASGTGYMRHPSATTTAKTNIAEGTAIGGSAYFYGSSAAIVGTLDGQWSLNSTGLVGFKFKGEDALTHYGWMRIAIGASLADRTLVDLGYESVAGEAIFAGAPAPGALALLGVAGLASRRRR